MSQPEKKNYYYPSINDEDFNQKIVNNSEFNQYKTLIDKIENQVQIEEETEKICQSNNFIHRNITKLVRKFISPDTPYNGILIFHGTGVGKTCTAINIAEGFHEYSLNLVSYIYLIFLLECP